MQKRVYLDLNESTYSINYEGLTFYFSSTFNETRFLNNVDDFVKMLHDKQLEAGSVAT